MFIVSFKLPATGAGLTGTFLYPGKNDTVNSGYRIKVDTFKLSIIPPSSGVKFYRDGIIYLSSSKSEKNMPDNHVSFGKIEARYGLLNNDSLESIRSFSSNMPFNFPCEAMTFSSDYKTMFFTRFSDKDRAEKIYKAVCTPGEDHWTLSDAPLDFCNDNSIYTHPALSSDGKLLIFASNRKGSVGGMDLFVSQNREGIWSDPVNLGVEVNTMSNELYPYVDLENNLYFSSDRKEGCGGYDIYVCKFTGDAWGNPVNLSLPVNTEYDDVAFIVNRKDGKSGFYSIKQNHGKGSIQLFMVEINKSNDTLLTLSQYFTKADISPLALSSDNELSDEQANKGPGSVELSVTSPAPLKASETNTEVIKTETSSGNETVRASQSTQSAKAEGSAEKKNDVVYRIQFQSNIKPKGSYKITIEGKTYDTYEYQYAGAYRSAVGEFSALSSAGKFQASMRKSGYSQAFVVAFKNNVRSTDPALFK